MKDAITTPEDGVLPVLVDAIPAELRERDQWVVWRLEQRGNDKPTGTPGGYPPGKPNPTAAR